MSYESTLEYIHAVQWRGQKPGLSRTQSLLAHLGNPERALKFVHVGGTNGKGSTCAMLASVLRAAGYRTGLYTSPYINCFRERIQVDGEMIPPQALEAVVDEIRPWADAMADPPSEFELITAAALRYFRQQRCDIVVLEVGLGGEFDATNVIPAPEVAVLTAIGLDHTAVLGGTVEAIARTKSGIIKPGSAVVSYGQPPEANAVIQDVCARQGTPLYTVNFDALNIKNQDISGTVFDFSGRGDLFLPLPGSYQPKNAAVALTALDVLRRRGWNIPEDAIRTGLAAVQWPGRFEVLSRSPLFLLDGSHNPQGMAATTESLRRLLPGQKFIFLISMMADKVVDAMLSLLLPLAADFVAVAADIPRAMPAEALAERVRGLGGAVTVCSTIPEGVRTARALAGDGAVCALGTLYFSGDVRRAFGDMK